MPAHPFAYYVRSFKHIDIAIDIAIDIGPAVDVDTSDLFSVTLFQSSPVQSSPLQEKKIL